MFVIDFHDRSISALLRVVHSFLPSECDVNSLKAAFTDKTKQRAQKFHSMV